MGSDGNIMPLHLYKDYFLGQQKNNWQQPKIRTCPIKMHTTITTITQLGLCKVKIEYNNVQKMCKFFVVPGNMASIVRNA